MSNNNDLLMRYQQVEQKTEVKESPKLWQLHYYLRSNNDTKVREILGEETAQELEKL